MEVQQPLSAHVPMDRRRALAEGRALPERVQGAVLFADISGFTPLTQALAEELGPKRGAEALTEQLNRFFDRLIAEVHRYRGSVISFSGDAITCWFDEDEGERALASALAMQAAASGFHELRTPGGQVFGLGVRVAVATGGATRLALGDPALRRIDVLAGEAVDRVSQIDALGRPGQVIVDLRTARRLGLEDGDGERLGAGAGRALRVGRHEPRAEPSPWPDAPVLDAETASAWVLPAVVERLQHGGGRFLTELRPAVALFLSFRGLELEAGPVARSELDAYVCWVQSVADHHGGHLISLTMGDKGNYAYLAFGAPTSQEDDAGLATAAALELLDPPAGLAGRVETRIGIAQGRMWTGALGGSSRCAYTTIGQPVNVAARLMGRAERDSILVSGEVAALASGGYEFQPLPSMALKGQAEPESIARLVGARHAGSERLLKGRPMPPMVGRDAERAAIAARLAELRTGEGGVLVVEGEAGIGKSRLMADLREQAAIAGVRLLYGAAYANERSAPYFAWRPIVEHLVGAQHDREALRESVLKALEAIDSSLVPRAPLLNALLPLELPDSEVTAAMQGDVRAENTNALMLRLLAREAARQPLVIVLEDGHWMDSSSWALASLVSRELATALLCLATRPLSEPSPPEYHAILRRPRSQRLDLETLAREDIERLIAQRFGVARLPAELAAFIHAKAEGHPYFSEELAYALLEANLIELRRGRLVVSAEADGLDGIAFPDTIEGVIIARMDGLAPELQTTLKVASVIGRDFDVRALRSIYPIAEQRERLPELLAELERYDIARAVASEPAPVYSFKHVISQEVAYDLLSYSQRAELHRGTALWYEEQHGDALDRYYPLLAHHWSEAEQTDRSIHYQELAGEQAFRTGANLEAIDFFRAAIEADRRDPQEIDGLRRSRWEHRLGYSLLSVGRVDESVEHTSAALGHVGRPVPRSKPGLAAALGGQVLRQGLHRLAPGRYLGQAERPDERLAAAAMYQDLGTAVYHQSDALAATYATLRQLNEAESAPPSGQLAQAYAATSVVAGMAQLHRLSAAYVELSRAVMPDAERQDRGFACELVSMYLGSVGRWAEAESYAEEGLECFAHSGNLRRWQEMYSALSLCLVARGELGRARALCDELQEISDSGENPQAQVWAAVQLATIDLLEGRIEDAVLRLEAALPRSTTIGHSDRIWIEGTHAAARLRRGDHDAARQAADRTLRLVEETAPSAYYAKDGYIGVAEACIGTWDPRAPDARSGRALAARGLRAARQFARVFPIGRPLTHLWAGTFADKDGAARKAVARWRKGLSLAESMGLPYDAARLRLELGRHAERGDPARPRHLQAAAEAFAALGAAADAERARTALREDQSET